MRSTACDVVCALIDREAIGWTEAERLRVEQHLSECPSCSETLSLSRFVRDTLKEAAGELSETARSRAIRNAFVESAKRTSSPYRQTTWPRWLLGASLAAAAAVTLWVVQKPAQQIAAPAQKPAQVAQDTKPALAEAEPKKSVESEPLPSADPVIVESKGRESHTFAHATVQFSASTRTRFEAATRTLSLDYGAIDVEVDPSKGEPFHVATQNFRVEVLGTRFSVTSESVKVQHGRVRVLALNGDMLAEALGAGGTFTLASSPQQAKARSAGTSPTKPSSAANAKTLLAAAHGALSRDDRAGARTLVRQAEDAHPSRAERAEAGTLRAEISLIERDMAGALRAYREVATHYAELPAGENAAFAAAQLAAKVEPLSARGLLNAYLARYPKGRFVAEATERLRRLPSQ